VSDAPAPPPRARPTSLQFVRAERLARTFVAECEILTRDGHALLEDLAQLHAGGCAEAAERLVIEFTENVKRYVGRLQQIVAEADE
jgi:hypothetical protein